MASFRSTYTATENPKLMRREIEELADGEPGPGSRIPTHVASSTKERKMVSAPVRRSS